MSGHSKWATIKHKKGANDKRRGKLFAKLIRQVEVAARGGGGDLDANPTLRTMYQKARDNSVPLDTIERAIKRGIGELEGVDYEESFYEGYATNGIALYVETLTDNKNRTASEIKALFSKNGGSMAEPGAVSWQFQKKGVVILPQNEEAENEQKEEEVLMDVVLEAGAEDLEDEGDTWRVICEPAALQSVIDTLEKSSFEITTSELSMIPDQTVSVEKTEDAKAILRLLDLLDDHDDVQGVYSNFDIPDEILHQATS